ncbi:unnamed protein product [Amoebophrya sp. A120]|nr:unnamed protein product [Amoebophrya sp. A120]|eukprot:GSA120T00022750001.1
MKCCLQPADERTAEARKLWQAVEARDLVKVQRIVQPIYETAFGKSYQVDQTGDFQDVAIPGYNRTGTTSGLGQPQPRTSGGSSGSSQPRQLSGYAVMVPIPQYINYSALLPQQRNALAVLETCNSNGETVLWYAAVNLHLALVQLLCSAGANLNPVDRSNAGTTLMHAVVRATCFASSISDVDRGSQVIEYLAKKGTDFNALASRAPRDTPLLFALKCKSESVALRLLQVGANAFLHDAFLNSASHVAAANCLDTVLTRLLQLAEDDEGSPNKRRVSEVSGRGSENKAASNVGRLLKKQNADGQTPVMCARAAGIAPQLQLSPSGEWLALSPVASILQNNQGGIIYCSCCGALIQADPQLGERVWVSGDRGWVKCQLCAFSPFFPNNHVLACTLALQAGDIYSLTDAVEGCWLAGLTPPNVGPSDMHPKVSEAISTLVTTLQQHLRSAIEQQDVKELERGIEMLSYSKISGLREDGEARDLLVKIKLQKAIQNENESELKQAVMTADQYERTQLPEYEQAQKLLTLIELREKVFEARKQLQWSLQHSDMRLLAVSLKIMQDAILAAREGQSSPLKANIPSVTDEDEKLLQKGWRVFSRYLADACDFFEENKVYKALECAKSYGFDEAVLQQNVDEQTGRKDSLRKMEQALEKFVTRNLQKAIEKFDRDLLQKAISDAEKYHLTKFVEYDNAKTELLLFPQKYAIRLLHSATDTLQSGGKVNKQKLEEALRNLYFNDEVKNSGLEHTPEAKRAVGLYRTAFEIPNHFDMNYVLKKLQFDSNGQEFVAAFRKPRNELVSIVQDLFDLTAIRKRTRDRRGVVPRGLEVVSVAHVQNHKIWVNYLRAKNKIARRFESPPDGAGAGAGAAGTTAGAKKKLYNDTGKPDMVKTLGRLRSSGRTFHDHWQRMTNEDTIDSTINEYYLFHGTRPEAALSITDTDFKVNLAGTNAGSLYGRGVYFGESVMKADEYAQENDAGVNPILICRVVLGRILYEDSIYPNPDNLVTSCVKGDFDSVLGDREKCRGTYREFITYDADNVYPEFLVWYRRLT